jgi:hypothetical protein
VGAVPSSTAASKVAAVSPSITIRTTLSGI